jgi:hypothetical protein
MWSWAAVAPVAVVMALLEPIHHFLALELPPSPALVAVVAVKILRVPLRVALLAPVALLLVAALPTTKVETGLPALR